jgi:hypothetical protein
MHAKPEFPKMSKDMTGPPNKIVTRLDEKNTVVCEKRSSNEQASRTREALSPVVFPYSRVMNSGFEIPSGHQRFHCRWAEIKTLPGNMKNKAAQTKNLIGHTYPSGHESDDSGPKWHAP